MDIIVDLDVAGAKLTDSDIFTGTWVDWDTGRPVRIDNPHTAYPGDYHRYNYEVAKRGDRVRLEMLDIFEAKTIDPATGEPDWYFRSEATAGPAKRRVLEWDALADCYLGKKQLRDGAHGGVIGYLEVLTVVDPSHLVFREVNVEAVDRNGPFTIGPGYTIRQDLVLGRFSADPISRPRLGDIGEFADLDRRVAKLEAEMGVLIGRRGGA